MLVTPKLVGLATTMRVTTKGALRKRLAVELSDGRDACDL